MTQSNSCFVISKIRNEQFVELTINGPYRNWHQVEYAVDDSNPFQTFEHGDRWVRYRDPDLWLVENGTISQWSVMHSFFSCAYYFESHVDAVAFTLRWK